MSDLEIEVKHFDDVTQVGSWLNRVWSEPRNSPRKRFVARYMPNLRGKQVKAFPTRKAAIVWLSDKIKGGAK